MFSSDPRNIPVEIWDGSENQKAQPVPSCLSEKCVYFPWDSKLAGESFYDAGGKKSFPNSSFLRELSEMWKSLAWIKVI